jgi:hypothetical protein
LCVYREVELIKETAAAAKQEPSDAVAIISYDEKPGIQATCARPSHAITNITALKSWGMRIAKGLTRAHWPQCGSILLCILASPGAGAFPHRSN